jgi:hypothetical protein
MLNAMVEMCNKLKQPQYQQSGNAGKLQQLLRWLKPKPIYDITFGDDDQITDKGDYYTGIFNCH